MGELISVIVPAYNTAQYLPNCLKSLLAQTYENIEIVVVNDGSTDDTGSIAESFSTMYPDIIKVVHQKNMGVSKARLTGISIAGGNWIGFTDSDDEVEPDMYRHLLSNALEYRADISHCGYQTIVNGGERIHYFYNTGIIVEQDRTKGLLDLVEGAFIEPGLWNKLFKRELIERLLSDEAMDSTIKYNEDLMMNYLLFSYSSKAIYEDVCLYHYLAHNSSASRSTFNKDRVLDPVKVRQWIINQNDSKILDLAWRRYLTTCGNGYYVFSCRNDCKEEAKKLKNDLLSNRDKWHKLSKKEVTKLRLILYTPHLYRFIYGVYKTLFQKTIYE